MITHPKERYMQMAIEEAKLSVQWDEYSIGSVIVKNNNILAVEHTRINELNDPTAHAEILAIQMAANKINCKSLEGAYLYSTLEPCPMCISAAIWANMKGVIFGATLEDAKKYSFKAIHELHDCDWRQISIKAEYVIKHGTPKLEVHSKFMRNECMKLFSLTT